MAFVYKSERDSSPNSSLITPAPGQYLGPDNYKFDQNQAPFLSNSLRMNENDHTLEVPEPTPQVVVIKNSVRGNNVSTRLSSQGPNSARASVSFQSKVERFNEPLRNIPGPGAYNRNSRMGKRYNMPPLNSSRSQQDSQRVLLRNRSVPSIPSQMHSHGYSEAQNGSLLLNEHPIEETQELPGTRMHEMKDIPTSKKVKGAPWSKVSEKTVQAYIPKVATIDAVGPGTYEATDRSSVSTQRRLSCGFNSKVDRNCQIKMRRSSSTARMRPSYNVALPALHAISQTLRLTENDENDSDEYDEYVKDSTPGPGYYYNSSTASSFHSKATSIKSRKSEGEGTKGVILQGKSELLGGATERFKERPSAVGDIGPGQYEIKRNLTLKTDMSRKKIPFRISDLRFEKSKMFNAPGPGAYQVELKMGKDFSEKAKAIEERHSAELVEGLPGSKIKIEELLNDNKKIFKNRTPGPGDYNPKVMLEMGRPAKEEKLSYGFMAQPRTETFGQFNENPSVGAYNVDQFDIATKVIKEEDDMELSPRRPGFLSSNPRFKGNKQEDSDDDEEINWKPRRDLASVLKAQQPPKKSVMFASKVNKIPNEEAKNLIPGPGSYHNSRQSAWNKQSFNVQFSSATYK